jgi:4-amino-4-deoxy-L-arabinose transferase-like glycosyltransferase
MKQSKITRNKGLILTIALGMVLRLIDIARPFSGVYKWNEGHYAVTALNYFKYGLLLPMNEYGLDLTTSPLFSWLIYLSFRVFGVHEWAARIPSFTFGVLSLFLVYYLSKSLYKKNVAVLATFIAAVSPGVIYFSRNVQLESMFTAFTLASLLFLIYYKNSPNSIWFILSGISLSIAIFTKYTAILVYPALLWVWFSHNTFKREKVEKIKIIIYSTLPIIPSALWAYLSYSLNPGLSKWYISKPEAPWTLLKALTALYEAIATSLPEHFGGIFFYPLVLTLPIIFTEFRRHAVTLIFTIVWLPLIFLFPEFYLKNTYYHYPMLYGMSILLAYTLIRIMDGFEASSLTKKRLSLFMVFLILSISLYQYNSVFHSNYTDFSNINETEPFYSAKYVAQNNTLHELVVVDFPMTMFYAGGDPAYVRPAYYNDGILSAIREDKYPYFVFYYSGNQTIKEALEEYNYTQIAPRAWHKKISNSTG